MKFLNTPITDNLDNRLHNFSKDNGMYKKKVVELALIKYMDSEEKKAQKNSQQS